MSPRSIMQACLFLASISSLVSAHPAAANGTEERRAKGGANGGGGCNELTGTGCPQAAFARDGGVLVLDYTTRTYQLPTAGRVGISARVVGCTSEPPIANSRIEPHLFLRYGVNIGEFGAKQIALDGSIQWMTISLPMIRVQLYSQVENAGDHESCKLEYSVWGPDGRIIVDDQGRPAVYSTLVVKDLGNIKYLTFILADEP
jgi:hypothetical protein